MDDAGKLYRITVDKYANSVIADSDTVSRFEALQVHNLGRTIGLVNLLNRVSNVVFYGLHPYFLNVFLELPQK